MTLSLDLPADLEAALTEAATARGLSLKTYAVEALRQQAREEAQDAAQDEADADEVRHILATSDPSQRRTQAELRAHLEAQGVLAPKDGA